jgi:Mlc titration factor MtfA (ptsG expression regulator)
MTNVAAFLVGTFGLLVIAALLAMPSMHAAKMQSIMAQPFPPEWAAILQERVPLVDSLSADQQQRLHQLIQLFVAQKTFIGCAGLVVDDEMRVTVAALACLLTLGCPRGHYARLHQVLLYPGMYMANHERIDANGLVNDDRQFLGGESWEAGQVVLSWQNVLDDAADPHTGRNIVIHEFAHQIDSQHGLATGAPSMPDPADNDRWHLILRAEYAALRTAIATQQPHLFRDYGAVNPIEFFAVITEVFFTQPRQLASAHPALYFELSGFYALEPVAWV